MVRVINLVSGEVGLVNIHNLVPIRCPHPEDHALAKQRREKLAKDLAKIKMQKSKTKNGKRTLSACATARHCNAAKRETAPTANRLMAKAAKKCQCIQYAGAR